MQLAFYAIFRALQICNGPLKLTAGAGLLFKHCYQRFLKILILVAQKVPRGLWGRAVKEFLRSEPYWPRYGRFSRAHPK